MNTRPRLPEAGHEQAQDHRCRCRGPVRGRSSLWDIHYVIDESEQGVLTNFGRIVPPVKGPGLHFKLPTPISMVYKIDRRVRPLTGLKQEFITEDQKNVLVDGYLLWRISNPISLRRGHPHRDQCV